jgi:hypothetical protein
VKTLTGQAIHLSVEASTTIEDVKLDIQRQAGFPVHQQRLIFYGSRLREYADDETMDDCHIHITHNVLHLLLTLHRRPNPKVTRELRKLQ